MIGRGYCKHTRRILFLQSWKIKWPRWHRLPLIITLVAAAAPALGQETNQERNQPGWWFPGQFSGYASVTNNYDYRGITETDDDPAIQGSIDYRLATGVAGTDVYAGVWGSNVNFNDGGGAHVELGWSFGLNGQIADTGLGWRLGGVYYAYPSRGGYNYWDIPASLSYRLGWFELRGGLNYSPDYFNGSGPGWYPNGGFRVSIPVPDNLFTLAFDAFGGAQWIDNNTRTGFEDYRDWKIGFVVGIKNMAFSAYYVDTDLDRKDCSDTNKCAAKGVVAMTIAF